LIYATKLRRENDAHAMLLSDKHHAGLRANERTHFLSSTEAGGAKYTAFFVILRGTHTNCTEGKGKKKYTIIFNACHFFL
jgi:hypothetical protein